MLKHKIFFAFFLVLSGGIIASHSHAGLGEPVDSLEKDRASLLGKRQAPVTHPGFSVHEIVSDSVTLREYASKDGIIFGIAWVGLRHPEVESLLGSFSEGYQESVNQTPKKKGARRYTVKNESIVVEKWGHPRKLQGRAYASRLLPTGVSPDEIK